MNDSATRLSPQSHQEQESRSQFKLRLLKLGGWLTDDITIDLGEDFIVRIYEDGVWSGLSFFVQIKSTSDIDNLRVGDEFISQRFAVKDLKHWSASAVPVFLVVWDVTETRKFGYWISVLDAIDWLNRNNSGWQTSNGAVQVWIPTANITDDAGFGKIRTYLSRYFLPSLSKAQPLELNLSLSFPKTPEGEQMYRAIQDFIETGNTVVVDRKFIEEVKYSDWYTRAVGKGEITQLTLASSVGESVATRIDLITRKGTIVSLPYIDLRSTKRGTKQVTVSNRHQPMAIHIEFTVNLDLEPIPEQLINSDPNQILLPKDPTKFALEVQFETNTNQKANVQDVKDAVSFLENLADGSMLRLITLSTAKTQDFPAPARMKGNKIDPEFIELVDKLCFIQQQIGTHLTMSTWSITSGETQLIRELTEILQTGRVSFQDEILTITLDRQNLENVIQASSQQQPILLESEHENVEVQLFDTSIQLGPVTRNISLIPKLEVSELRDLLHQTNADETQNVDFELVSGTDIYKNWPKVP